MRISVIGGRTIEDEQATIAESVGRELGRRGHTVICGGLGGTMEAVCRGANAEGGETIGILPVEDRDRANEFVDTPIATGMGHARNALVPLNGDGVIALAGGSGTLSEIALAGVYDRPVAGIGTHDAPGVEAVETPDEAVDYLEEAVRR
ncbi:TIGR00725 family protein [Natrialbaceae archaeon AArc-T1-2]|uniref:TIGR00725 family protein n=1 Tax=Natrialbaceae archaeon AArc-T1-2 TaxID=3053904 RepID=UPI00255AA534|nr:TIGR00725 family protein [Natrialbaceae archaeon AArc-T1-2]WIV65651.1 TIGR00725 family protein [Natrialbaceae archaeon AArc-T1-2]